MDFRPRSAHPKLVAGQACRSFDLFKLRTEHEQLSLVSVYIILSPILTISINAFALKRQSRVLFLDQRVELFFEQIPFDASSRRFIYFSRNSFKRFFRFSPVKSFIEALTFFFSFQNALRTTATCPRASTCSQRALFRIVSRSQATER